MKLSLLLPFVLLLIIPGCDSIPSSSLTRKQVDCGKNPRTAVMQLGRYLSSLAVPYCVDPEGRPIQTDNLVVHFHDTVSEHTIKLLQKQFAPDVIKTCLCDDRLQNWKWNTPINIEEKTSQVSEAAKREGGLGSGAFYNYYVHITIPGQHPKIPIPIANTFPDNGTPQSKGKLIAVLDTGIDPSLIQSGIVNLNSEMGPCKTAMPHGWNFIDNNANIADDNGHGTAVTGIISETLLQLEKQYLCGSRFLILKMLDDKGTGGVFEALCALQYAIDAGAEVINVSWGYYGLDLGLMSETIKGRKPSTHIVTSMGNDALITDGANRMHFHYPSHYARSIDRVYEVGGDRRRDIGVSLFTPRGLWQRSNYAVSVPINSAPSLKVPVLTPPSPSVANSSSRRSADGTSYAAAFVSAKMTVEQCCSMQSGRNPSPVSHTGYVPGTVSHRGHPITVRLVSIERGNPCN